MSAKKTVSWRSPSNIALVKYWGKTGVQIPANASLSFTLSHCYTETAILAEKTLPDDKIEIKVFLNGLVREDFRDKIYTLLDRLGEEANFLRGYYLEVKTMNSFPHSSGIASSASGMSALVLCLLSLKESITGLKDPDFMERSSRWSRLASGSACRSVYGGAVLWGKTPSIPHGNTDYGVSIGHTFHPTFQNYKDYVLIVEKGQKPVSSSAGHALMNNHPFAKMRFDQAAKNLEELLQSLKSGDIEKFGEIVESEALQLHSMMMTSRPYYLLMKPNTVAVIEEIWEFRQKKNVPVYFTLDAGANVHMLFPNQYESEVKTWMDASIKHYLHEGDFIADEVGKGPERLF